MSHCVDEGGTCVTVVQNPRSIWVWALEPVQKLDEMEIRATCHSARAAAGDDADRGAVAATWCSREVHVIKSGAGVGPTVQNSIWVKLADALLLLDPVSFHPPDTRWVAQRSAVLLRNLS